MLKLWYRIFFGGVSICKVISKIMYPDVTMYVCLGKVHIDQSAIWKNIQTKGSSLGPTFGFGPSTSCGNDLQYPKIHTTKYPQKRQDQFCLGKL